MPKQVLIVDDDPNTVKYLSLVLSENGYDPVSAADGSEGLEKAKQAVPDLFVLDVMMPRIDGFQVTRVVKSDDNLKHIKIILLSAKGQDSDRDTGVAAGADDYMTKPFSPTRIVERARQILDSP